MSELDPQETSETARVAPALLPAVVPHGKGFAAPPVAPSPKQSDPTWDAEWIYRENPNSGLRLYRRPPYAIAAEADVEHVVYVDGAE